MGKLLKLIKKRIGKGFTFLIVPNSSKTVRSFSIPFLLLVGIVGLIVFNLYIFLGFTTQVWQIERFRMEIWEKEQRIAKLEGEHQKVQPTLERSHELAKELAKLKEERAKLLNTLKAIRQKAPHINLPVNRGASVRTNPYILKPLPGNGKEKTSLEKLDHNLKQLSIYIHEETKEQSEILSDLLAYETKLDHTPSIWPVVSAVTSWFGFRFHPSYRSYRKHDGLDIQADYGTVVRAAADGVVKSAGYRGGYGYAVLLDHGYGLETLYGHNSKILVETGQKVKKGQKITLSGNSGTSTGPHLHYEVRLNGNPVNPTKYLH